MDTNPSSGVPVPPPAPVGSNNNVVMAVLSYLGILIIIPFLTDAKNDPFVKFHMKQGLVLIIVWIVIGIANSMLWRIPLFGFLIGSVLNLGCFVLMIVGIINAAGGKMKELPLVGHFASNFKF
ncbi:MAG: DUF4870 domain-containing protein [Minisyncoccia bacterium]